MTTTVTELKLLLALNGNSRLPHLEEEIFANSVLTVTYLYCLSRVFITNAYTMYDTVEDFVILERQAWAVYYYCSLILKEPWEEAEVVLMNYAMEVGFGNDYNYFTMYYALYRKKKPQWQ